MLVRGCWLLLLLASPVTAAESVALLDISGPQETDWSAQDRRLFERLSAGIARAIGRQVENSSDWFAEPPDPVWAQLAKQAEQLLRQGEGSYWGLKPQQAISELKEALRVLRAAFPGLENLSPLEQTHLLLGATYQSLGQTAEADLNYRQVLLLEPEHRPDESRFNPMVVERFEKIRGRLLSETRGSISFISQPPGALLKLNGRTAGVTPLTVPGMLPGAHYASLSLAGYRTWFGIVELQPGGNLRQEIFLQEGSSMKLLRHRQQLERAGTAGARSEDTRPILEATGVHWLILAAVRHLGDQASLELAIAEAPSGEVAALGVFRGSEAEIEAACRRVAGWLRGERTFLLRRAESSGDEATDTTRPPLPPPPSGPPWYRAWWFWAAVGAVAAGVAGTTAGLLLTRQSGYRVEVIR